MTCNLLVIGGTGTIGREVVRQALDLKSPFSYYQVGDGGRPVDGIMVGIQFDSITCLSRCDTRQLELFEELGRPERLHMHIGDIRDPDSLPDHEGPVIHLAALKHVPACEQQPGQAVACNYFGTVNVLRKYGNAVTYISTDKAVQPINTYGMTKALAERVALKADAKVCRLVNITGSRGSLLPMAERQAKHGSVYLTHEDMERHFMTAERAAKLILHVVRNGEGGMVHMPAGVESVRIKGLLEEVASKHGAKLEVIGPRPVEKMIEDLHWPGEVVQWV